MKDDEKCYELPIGRGLVTIVDSGDYEKCSNLKLGSKWDSKKKCFYATAWFRGGKCGHKIPLARVILGLDMFDLREVDHIDNKNTLDNRHSNLRVGTTSQNQANAVRRVDNTSGFNGVYWNKKRKRWVALIRVKGRRYGLGGFVTPQDAHVAYCKAAVKHFGEFARFE